MTKQALIVHDHGPSHFRPFEFLGLTPTTDINILFETPREVGLVVFTGGDDVTPALYGAVADPRTCNSIKRDKIEVAVFEQAQKYDIPKVGICRGAQFLCVMAGGKLVQDLSGHYSPHHLRYCIKGGSVVTSPEAVSSSHHQNQHPFNLPHEEYQVLAWSDEARSTHYSFGDHAVTADQANPSLCMEVDCCYYPKIRALAMQYHPEWMEESSWGFQFSQQLTMKYLFHHTNQAIAGQ